ncbi:hypothetical protein C5167_016869 [Papaver somniferum]|uniref:Uncharacterized protein n=1 Tax=Papaver somniferum TaxID=3469 RepID=A0A4Y7IHS1_PAPSO|nr:hypothetical protein C5167_016869 [Papaver somniferum]
MLKTSDLPRVLSFLINRTLYTVNAAEFLSFINGGINKSMKVIYVINICTAVGSLIVSDADYLGAHPIKKSTEDLVNRYSKVWLTAKSLVDSNLLGLMGLQLPQPEHDATTHAASKKDAK